mmetsp:Transcript_35355/g.82638  ORF Transcript_35355/g.82638 Transcript_35355/m.82638 type:complete len:83 (-) Transcript_35355:3-251(-)
MALLTCSSAAAEEAGQAADSSQVWLSSTSASALTHAAPKEKKKRKREKALQDARIMQGGSVPKEGAESGYIIDRVFLEPTMA